MMLIQGIVIEKEEEQVPEKVEKIEKPKEQPRESRHRE